MTTAVNSVNDHSAQQAFGKPATLRRPPTGVSVDAGQAFRQILPFVLRYPALLAAFTVFLLLSSGLTLMLPAVFRLVIDCSIAAASPACHFESANPVQSVYFFAGLVVATLLGATTALRYYFISQLGERVVADLRQAVYARLLLLSADYHAEKHTGELLSRLTADTTLIQSIVGSSLSVTLRSCVTIIGALALAFVVSWKLTLMVVLIGPAIVLPATFFGRRLQNLSRDSQDCLAEASARASECLQSIQTIQLFSRETAEMEGFAAAIKANFVASMRRTRERAVMTLVIFTVMFSGLLLLLWIGAVQVASGGLTAGEMTQFILYAFVAISCAGMLMETFAELKRAAGAAERLAEILTAEPTIQSPSSAVSLPRSVTGAIEFENVSFTYANTTNALALDSVSLSINAGETVALVGPSGAGKSTLFRLLTRLNDHCAGYISLDGVNIKMLELADLRSAFAVVQQDAPTFSGTVFDNIRFGQSDASLEEIVVAAKAADAHVFISKLPQGYNTRLGENGETLSGGQRQRIAIARAMLKRAPVLLLDEATSALDAESEHLVQKALKTFSGNHTTLVIAHRLATVQHADRIIVMDGGRVVDHGTHTELLAAGGLYARHVRLLQV